MVCTMPADDRLDTLDILDTIDAFDYKFSGELIAQYPEERRDSARMLVLIRETGSIQHHAVSDLPTLLESGDVLVLNDTKVRPSRIDGIRPETGGKVELLFLKEATQSAHWHCLAKSAKPLLTDDLIELCGGCRVIVTHGSAEEITIAPTTPMNVRDYLERYGRMPLPPYIRRSTLDRSMEPLDRERYQTTFAKREGLVAAPTAGLHFTPELFAALAQRGVRIAYITLHLGWGSFRPIRVPYLHDHTMLSEQYAVSADTMSMLTDANRCGQRIVGIGTTTMRTLESCADRHGSPCHQSGETTLFIRPGYSFRLVSGFLTNFHQPRSTMIVMAAAFAGHTFLMQAYQEAIRQRYRFFSYGDCMLIL